MSGIAVCVVYALPDRQVIKEVMLPAGATVADALTASGLAREFPDIDLTRNRVGIFGRLAGADTQVQPGDQVEIYRPLQADPREARRRRARGKARSKTGT